MTDKKKAAEIVDIPEDDFFRDAKPAGTRSSRRRTGERSASKAKPAGKPAKAAKERGTRAKAEAPSAEKRDVKRKPAKKRRGIPLADMSDDLFLEEWDVKPKKRKKKKKKRMTPAMVAVNAGLGVGIAAIIALGGMLFMRHDAFAEMKAVVEAQTFYDGTTVEGIDVSGMTLNDAKARWEKEIEPRYADREVTLKGDTTITARDMGYQSDYAAVLESAWSAGRRGSLEQRYHAAMNRQAHPVAYEVNRTLYSDEAVDAYVQAVAERVDRPATDASIQSFDSQNYAFVLTEGEKGARLDAERMSQSIKSALKAGGGSAEIVVETLEPQVTTEDVTSKYGMISSAVTNASSSSSNRLKNIKLAVSMLNGTCLKPGETFSFNQAVGQRTTERGFRRATAYSGGDVTEEIGGGICQVSTTLFNAAVKADMEILERHNHSLTVSYVDRGKDAAVSWDSQDLKFKNNSPDDVYICCFVSDDKRVRFGIFGRLLENGETITLEGVTTETTKYETQYELSPFLAPGQMAQLSPGKNGYKAEAYKIRWDAAGNQLSKELLCKSFYKVKNEVIQYGR